jgi:peptidyl-prolyl cis-trans isomerase D
MLSVFRKSPKLVVIIFALVALAFIATGVFTHEMPGTSSLTGSNGTTIAKVGGITLTAPDMEQRIRNQYAQSSQQQPGLDMASFVAQAFEPIVEQTIGATALEAFGRSIGLVASKKQIDGSIAAIPAFHGPDGNFSQQVYLAAIAQQHIGDAQVRSDLGGDLIRRMVYLPATGALTLPDGVIKAYAGLLMEQRAGSIGFVPVALTGGGTPPSDADVAAFYKAHLAVYTTPERRVLRYALIGRDQVAAGAIPSEADIRKVFDTTPDKYAARETRDISQVVLPTEAAAKAFKATVTGGKSFADAAKAAGFGAGDIAIGNKSQAQYAVQSSPTVAAAAFALPRGGVSDPVKSDFGWHVVKIDGITRIPATPYATARPQIAGDLAKAKQDAALAALLAKVQDALSNGQGFADVAKANGLSAIDTPALTAGGLAPDQPGYKPAPEVQPLLAAGFKAMPDDAASVQAIQQGERYAILSVARVVPAAPIPFAQAKPRVAADAAAFRASERAKAIATAIVAKVKGGTTIADAFKAAPVKLPDIHTTTGRRMDLAKLQGQVPPPLAALFRAPIGGTQLVPAGNGSGWYVVHVDKATPATDAELAPAVAGSRSDLVQAANDEYLEQLAGAAKLAVGTKRDQNAIAALHAKLLGATIVGQ